MVAPAIELFNDFHVEKKSFSKIGYAINRAAPETHQLTPKSSGVVGCGARRYDERHKSGNHCYAHHYD